MSSDSKIRLDSDSLADIIDAFTTEHQQGKSPSIEEYCRRYPNHSEVLGGLLPTIVALHNTEDAREAEPECGGATCGQTIGPYRLEANLGSGGFATVFSARDTRDGSTVALKVWDSRQLTSLQRSRIQREAKALSQLLVSQSSDTRLVRVIEVGRQSPWTYLAMERVDGCNLGEWIDQRGPLDADEAVRVGREIAHGLGIAHSLGIVHRDIKPSNVMRTATGEIKIVDFGLALHAITGQAASQLNTATISTKSERLLTQSGALLGTINYMAPEQALDPRAADVCSDIYSLGCTLYYLLVGSPPFPQSHPLPCLIAHREEEIPSVASKNQSVSPQLERVLRKAMAKRPVDRFASMSEFETAPARAATVGSSRRVQLTGLLAVAGSILAGVLLLIAMLFPRASPSSDDDGLNVRPNALLTIDERPSFVTSTDGSRLPVRWQWGDERFAHWNYIIDVVYADRGRQIISGGWDGDVVVWDTSDGSVLQRFASDAEVMNIALSHDEVHLAVGYDDGAIKVWNRTTGQARDLTVPSESDSSRSLAFSPTASWLAIATGSSSDVLIVDVTTDKTVAQFDRQNDEISSPVAFSTDGQTVFAVGDQNAVYRWRVSDQQSMRKFSPQPDTIVSLAIDPQADRLATLDDRGWIRLYDFDEPEPIHIVHAHDAPGRRCVYPPDGRSLLSSGEDQVIRRWDSETLTLQEVVADRTRSNWGLAVHPTKSVVASVGTDQRILFWPSRQEASVPLGGKVWSLAFSDDVERLALGGADGMIGIFDLTGRRSPNG